MCRIFLCGTFCIYIYKQFFYAVQVERLQLGEEVDYDYVAGALSSSVELWNQCVGSVREKLSNPETVLAEMNKLSGRYCGETNFQEVLASIKKQLETLKTISLKPSDEGFRQLV